MISLDKGPNAIELCRMYSGDPSEHHGSMEGTPVYYLPKKNKKYRMSVDDADDYLRSDQFRIRYKLNNEQHERLQDCLLDDKCPDEKDLIRKFYNIRENLENRLYEEMELSDEQYFRVDFSEDKKEWTKHVIKIGSTGSGKTYHSVSRALHNLQGPRAKRRNFTYVSTELEHDKTLQKLLAKRYQPWVTGVDTSQEAFDEWSENENTGSSIEEWFNDTIKPALENTQRSGHIWLDDSRDSPAHKQLRQWQNKAFRTLRHKNVGITSIQHNVRGNQWTSQGYSSVFGVMLFPSGSGKGKINRFLADDIGLGIRRGRELTKQFAETGRTLFCRMHSPSCLIGDRLLILL